MAYTQTQIDALKSAMASGVLTVRHGETTTTFRSLEEMERQLAKMESAVSSTTRTRVRYAYQSGKGL